MSPLLKSPPCITKDQMKT